MLTLQLYWDGELHPIELDDGEHVLGRSDECAVRVPVSVMSRKHAILRVEDDQLYVRDLGSTHGTEVDGKPVGATEVLVPESATLKFAGVPAWRAIPTTGISAEFSGDEQVSSRESYRMQDGYTEGARARIVEMLGSLFELVASGTDPDAVGQAACEFVSRWVRADRVVLLEEEGIGSGLEPHARWLRVPDQEDRLRLSHTLMDLVLRERQSVLVEDAFADPRTAGHMSIAALQLRSAMAAPLFDNQRVRGILYVDTADLTVRYTQDDLQVLTAAANAVAVKLRNLSLESEMQTAARIQKGLLPQHLSVPDGYEIAAHQVMCRSVGGDLYECIERPSGTVLLTVGDIAGKGMPAALAMSAALVLLRMLAEIEGPPEQLIQMLHRQLFKSLPTEQYLTLFFGELEPQSGRLVYVNAGHEPPRLVRASGTVEILESTGQPIALLETLRASAAQVELAPGDLLAVFSDGVSEATPDGEQFLGIEPLERTLVEMRGAPLPAIVDRARLEVEAFVGVAGAPDDVTLLLLRRT
jgi:sigma-B regulation protein RsbU (phosphoserine phosphatase)